MKEYPFEVYALCEFEGHVTACYMTKGHHNKRKFVEEVKAQYGTDININWVHHSYGKYIPVSGMSGVSLLHEFKKPVRGSFPMTYVNV